MADTPLIVPVQTSWTEAESQEVDQLRTALGGRAVVKKAGIYRAMLRYTLEHKTDFIEWLRETDGQPIPDGED